MPSEKEHPLLSNLQPSGEKSLPASGERKGASKIWGALKDFCEKQLSPGSKVTQWVARQYHESMNDERVKAILPNGKKDPQEIYHLVLSVVLTLVLIISFKAFPPILNEIDQLKNDLTEQAQVIKIEEENKKFLDRLAADNNALQEKINKVDEALPNKDERAEKMIADLEFIARNNKISLDSISINAVTDSQFYNDNLTGIVQPYEYNFSVESSLGNVLAFLETLRKSLRIMDVMTIDIEKTQDAYKGNFSIFAYHLIEY